MVKDKKLLSTLFSIILLVLGILFCCSLAIGIKGLSVIIGVILIFAGVISLTYTFMKQKNFLNSSGIVATLLLSLGIVFLAYELAGIIFLYIPWFLIVFGVLVLSEAVLEKVVYSSSNLLDFIIKLVVGVVSITLGICLLTINGFMEYASIVLGILMIIYALYTLLLKERFENIT